MGQNNAVCRRIICMPIKLYQLILRPVLPACCRFYPSCSQYSIEAFMHHGVVKGGYYMIHRLLRCHPWSLGGYDPIFSERETH